jgi:hypothetical protein
VDAEALRLRYRGLADDELRYIATHTELTETARDVLESELAARGIADLEDYRRQLDEEAAAERRAATRHFGWSENKPGRLHLLFSLLTFGIYVEPEHPGDASAPVIAIALYCIIAPCLQLVGLATVITKINPPLPAWYSLLAYFGPALLLVAGVLLWKRSAAALILITTHIAWVVLMRFVTAAVLETHPLYNGWLFVTALAVPLLILAWCVLLWRARVLR